MHDFYLYISVIIAVIILIPLVRLLRGPTLFDRLLGAGTIGTKTLVLVIIAGYAFDRSDMFIDITLAYAVLNFIGTVALAKYFEKRHES